MEKQKLSLTLVSLIAGLLVGGLIVWVFSTPDDKRPENAWEYCTKDVTYIDSNMLDICMKEYKENYDKLHY